MEKAVFTVDDTKVLTPGDTTANGDYKVSSDSEALVISGDVVASYEESLAGNKIKGYVLTDKLNNGTYDGSFKNAVAGATVSSRRRTVNNNRCKRLLRTSISSR